MFGKGSKLYKYRVLAQKIYKIPSMNPRNVAFATYVIIIIFNKRLRKIKSNLISMPSYPRLKPKKKKNQTFLIVLHYD